MVVLSRVALLVLFHTDNSTAIAKSKEVSATELRPNTSISIDVSESPKVDISYTAAEHRPEEGWR